MEGGDVYDEQKGGDGRSLRDPDGDGGEGARGPLERQAAGAVTEERADPLDQVWADPFGNYCDRVPSLYRLFTPTSLTLVTHNSSHTVL